MTTLIKEENAIENKEQLTDVFFKGIKQTKKLGLEYEKLPIYTKNHKAVEFFFKNGMLDFLSTLVKNNNLISYYENNILLGCSSKNGSVSLEPGCQLELSLKPFEKIADIEKYLDIYNNITSKSAKEMGIIFLALGCQPVSTFNNIKIIPKQRYEFMTKYFAQTETLPYVMMRETAGIQTSIDYSSEEDAIQKLSTALKLAPFLSAFFVNSPIRNGKMSGYKSFRANAWLHTDNKRCGLISTRLFQKNPDFTFADYTEILLNIPMIFSKTNYMEQMTFLEYFNQNKFVTQDDWQQQISLFFPDVRLKNYIEIRNHDCQKKELVLAVPALYKGIFYSQEGMEQINYLLNEFTYYDFEFVRSNAPRFGMDFQIKNKNVSDIVREIFKIAKIGLIEMNTGEENYLDCVFELLDDNLTPADIIIKNFEGMWNKNISKLIEYSMI